MRLSDTQLDAVAESGHLYVKACPGSGKTRVLVSKLVKVLESLADTNRKVACLTYTNSAVHEIEDRLEREAASLPRRSAEIATLHSFCLTNILRHYYWLVPEFADGFSVIDPDDDDYMDIVRSVCADNGLSLRNARNAFAQLRRDEDGAPISAEVPPQVAEDFWFRLATARLVDYPTIVYLSFSILQHQPRIAQGLAARYAWFLIDEAQDTSALQVGMLKLIWEHAGNADPQFFIVGDPAQSIFGFADARPALMDGFAKTIGARTDIEILGNYRSSPPVIADADALQPRSAPMVSLGDAGAYSEIPRHVHADSPLEAVYESFIPWLAELSVPLDRAVVLASQWVPLYALARQLHLRGVPVLGPGARPYRRRHLIAPLVEVLGAYASKPAPRRFRRVQGELYRLVDELTGVPDRSMLGFQGARVAITLVRASAAIRAHDDIASSWLQDLAASISAALEEEDLIPSNCAAAIRESAGGIEADMQSNGVDPSAMSVREMGLFGDPDGSLKLMTLHRSKGREFDAVAIVSVHDGMLPFWAALDPESVSESRRLFYVGVTRARRLLMYCTDDSHPRNRMSPFLEDVLASR